MLLAVDSWGTTVPLRASASPTTDGSAQFRFGFKLVGTTRVRQNLAADLDAMIAGYANGMGCVLLFRKYGIAESTVLARLKRLGARCGGRDTSALAR